MILDPANRRGYTFTESDYLSGSTIIESFDLDSLNVLHRVAVAGVPIPSGYGEEAAGGATFSGDIVHAVDPVTGRLYIPFHKLPVESVPFGSDTQRPVHFIAVLDEHRFDRDPSHALGFISFVGDDQRFQAYPLVGLAVSQHHRAPGGAGKLLALFASPNPQPDMTNVGPPVSYHGVFDHTLVEWDPTLVQTDEAAPPAGVKADAVPVRPLHSEWQQVVVPCATEPLSSGGTEERPYTLAKSFQWELLPTEDAVFLGCQSGPMSGAVARVPLDGTGKPALTAPQQLVPLGKPIGDVLADPDGGRLYLRSFGDGATWWAFDAATMRFAGSIAAHLIDSQAMAAGIDPGSGRLYTLTPDTCVPRRGGGETPFRGGLKFSEARLDPVPAQQNVRPDMAYNSWWRINVDPVTKRVFVRRGVALIASQLTYPNCDLAQAEPSPQEMFYRVFEDRIPVAAQPAELNDAPFTTNVSEARGLTQASFVGSGTGYGARVVLTGGLDAATNGGVTSAKSLCGRDDRELLVGSVGSVEVSDQSTRAEASSLDADARTQEVLGDPFSRCRPQAPPDAPSDLNRCLKQGDTRGDTDEFAFDDVYPDQRDYNSDGCPDRKGVNKYTAECSQDRDPEAVSGPSDRKVPRDGFIAKTKCEAAKEKANANAEGAMGSKLVDDFQREHKDAGIATDALRVGRSSSDVHVTRTLGEGITVKVDSVARGIELPGLGSIGVVRSEATSTATGRDGGAHGTFDRTICDVHVATLVVPGCVSDKALPGLVKQLNDAISGRGEIHLRDPDKPLIGGTSHGYLAAVQRDREQLFNDQTISRDHSLAVPGLEIVLFQGDGGTWGAGRQILQLAGAQASTSYGIACVFGQAADGKCAKDGDGFGGEPGPSITPTGSIDGGGQNNGSTIIERTSGSGHHDNPIVRLLKRIPQAIAEAMRLLFNNPRELGLMAAVWGLLYAPCYLGERRRSIGALHARRASAGGVG
jgi:hypothetical protein